MLEASVTFREHTSDFPLTGLDLPSRSVCRASVVRRGRKTGLELASVGIVVTRRFWVVPAAVMAAMLITFVVAEVLGVEPLTDPKALLGARGGVAAVAGAALLVADVILPVPSSGVMLAHGTLFGIVVGAALSLLGSLGAFALGFGLGRGGAPVLERLVSEEERSRADRLLRKWGVLAIVVTRPVPILAETTALVAGTSSLRWRPALVAALVGSLPGALLYAVAGALAASFATGAVVFAMVILFGLVVVVLSPRTGRDLAPVGPR
jgi:uncharacterized membrane protein YdjX (TVP38/TMEM64 family)